MGQKCPLYYLWTTRTRVLSALHWQGSYRQVCAKFKDFSRTTTGFIQASLHEIQGLVAGSIQASLCKFKDCSKTSCRVHTGKFTGMYNSRTFQGLVAGFIQASLCKSQGLFKELVAGLIQASLCKIQELFKG